MNKLATSLTLAAVIMFEVSGNDNPTLQPISTGDPVLLRHNSIAAIEHLITPPIAVQEESVDDSAIVMGSNAGSMVQHAGEIGTSTITIANHVRNVSKAVLETINDLKSGDISGAVTDIHKIGEEFNPELEKACSSCIGATGGFFSSVKEALKSFKNKLFGSKVSNPEDTSGAAETAEDTKKEG